METSLYHLRLSESHEEVTRKLIMQNQIKSCIGIQCYAFPNDNDMSHALMLTAQV